MVSKLFCCCFRFGNLICCCEIVCLFWFDLAEIFWVWVCYLLGFVNVIICYVA